MKRIFISTIALVLLASVCPGTGSAYDDELVHPTINEKAAANPIFDSFLKNKLGFDYGMDTFISGTYYEYATKREAPKQVSVIDWITNGGQAEDGPNLNFRYARHFHDPLKSLDNAGWGSFSSSFAWAQSTGQDYSWGKVRGHYYNALTTGSEAEYAATFRGVGQLMHLVSDMAVPSHVRNDIHPDVLGNLYSKAKGDFYEEWTKNRNSYIKENIHGVTVSPAIFTHANPQSTAESELAPAPITALWDQNRYLGSNPSVTLVDPATGMIGLAEYTNANFLSQDSMFEGYAHPKDTDSFITTIDWLNPRLEVAEDGVEDFRYYIMSDVGAAAPIRLVGGSFITRETWLYGNLTTPTYQIDDRVLQDYASILIPRAIGYSTALLGQSLEAFGPDSQGYPGQLVLAYEYVPAGATEPLRGFAGSICKIATPATPYVITAATDPINADFVKVTATLPSNNLIPPGASKIAFTVVYSGRLGNEDEAVAAKRYDFSENNSRIAFFYQPGGSGNPSNIYSVRPDGSDPLVYTNSVAGSGSYFFSPTWSRDGARLAFDKGTTVSYNVEVIDSIVAPYPANVTNTLAFAVSGYQYQAFQPSFSPDGTKVVTMVHDGVKYYGLAVFNLIAGTSALINGGADGLDKTYWKYKFLSEPSWSPQGDRIAYYYDSYQPSRVNPPTMINDIYTINPDGSDDRNLTNDGFSYNEEPSWSPDGEWIVFVSDRTDGNSLDIWVMDKDGNNKQKIKECPNHCWYPVFSPDGMRIAFNEANNIYSIKLNNTDLAQLTSSGYFTGRPSWSPYLQ